MEKAAKKKWILLGAAAAVLALVLLWALRPKTELDLPALSRQLLDAPSYARGMRKADPSQLESRWGLSPDAFPEVQAYVADDGTARQFLLLRAADKKSADEAASALNLYCHELIDRYKTEHPEEAARVKTYCLRRTRNYLIFTIGDGTEDPVAAVNDYFDKIRYDRYQ